ncbi:MAG TPA: TonB family protein, partial [Arenimonas sp.]|nr:TonB family protein [Arenimonas sp.]
MAADLWRELSELLLAVSAALLLIAALRKPARHLFGARAAYALWITLPLAALAILLPAPRVPPVPVQAMTSTVGASGIAATNVGAAPFDPLPWLLLWASGAVLTMLWLGYRQYRFQRELGELHPAVDGSHRSAFAQVPALVGLLRPRIVLPADFEQRYRTDEQALVLAHERAHLHHFDAWANAAAALALCLLWFHPLAWWALGRFRFDQELACDARVLDAAPQARRAYADALLKTQLHADAAWRLPLGCHWQSSHPLMERVAMLKRMQPTPARRLSGLALIIGLCCAAAAAAWASQPQLATPAENAAKLDVQLDIVVDGSIGAKPDIRVSSGEAFSFAVEEGDVKVSGDVVAILQDDGLILLKAEVRRNGNLIGNPTLQFDPDRGARIKIGGERAGEAFEMDVRATIVDDTPRLLQSLQSDDALAPPKYPAKAKAAGISGRVLLHVEVLPDGRVGDVKVVEATPVGTFEKAATDAARNWRFNPVRKNGIPVVGWLEIPVQFTADDKPADGETAANVALAPAESQSSRGAASTDSGAVMMEVADADQRKPENPLLARATPPAYPASAVQAHIGGKVVLRIQVNADGSTGEIKVEESSGHESLDLSAAAAASQWRFNPGKKNGKSVGGWVLVPVTFSPDRESSIATQSS